jgi:hypothetical protein
MRSDTNPKKIGRTVSRGRAHAQEASRDKGHIMSSHMSNGDKFVVRLALNYSLFS